MLSVTWVYLAFKKLLQALTPLIMTSAPKGPQWPHRSLALVAWALWCWQSGRDRLCPSPDFPHPHCLSSRRHGRAESLWCCTESGSSPTSAFATLELGQSVWPLEPQFPYLWNKDKEYSSARLWDGRHHCFQTWRYSRISWRFYCWDSPLRVSDSMGLEWGAPQTCIFTKLPVKLMLLVWGITL